MKADQKVVVSLLFVRPGKIGGVEHFCKNLLQGFLLIKAENKFLLLVTPELQQHAGWKQVLKQFECATIEPGANARFKEFFSTKYRRQLHLNLNYVTPLFASKNITVIHDALFKHFKGYFSALKYAWLLGMQKYTLKKADAVVCISKAVQEDLQPERQHIEVIYNPIDFNRFSTWEPPVYDKKIRLACLAANYPHKNLETIIEAVTHIHLGGIDVELELIGQKPSELSGGNFAAYGQKISALLEGKSYISTSGYLPDLQVSEKLKDCHLFLFPSLFEGFGMPPVEMLANGMPTLTSDLPVLKEVTKSFAHYIGEPQNPLAWKAKILSVMSMYEANCTEAKAATIEIQKAYHCSHIANQYLSLIEKISG